MRNNRVICSLAVLLATVLTVGGMSVLPTTAGKSEVVQDSTTTENEIDTARWSNPTGEVTAENGAFIFPSNSTQETRLITKASATTHEAFEVMANVNANMNFKKLPEGQKFVIALGLANIESMLGEPNNIEIAFANQGGLTVAVTAYDEQGAVVDVMTTKKLGSSMQAKLEAEITTSGELKVVVNGREICNSKVPGTGKGRVGFLQTGSCEVKVSDVEIKYYRYETPENCDIFEDFESGTYNKYLLTSHEVHASAADAPTRACIEEYQGNQVYMLSNVGAFYFGTMHKYSNFELSFDVPYLQRVTEKDADGYLLHKESQAIGVAFGGDGADYQDWGFLTSADMVLFSRDSSTSSYKSNYTVIDPEYMFFDADCTRGFSIKVSVIDAVVTVYMKWIDEDEFKQVNQYSLGGETPTGYVQIWTTGTGSFAFDNFKIVNKDINPQLVEVEYASPKIEIPEDYNYQPMEKVYAPVKENEKGIKWYTIVGGVAILCVISLAVTGAVKYTKNKRGKDGVTNEEKVS